MRVGYGYERTAADFAGLECERLFIDTKETGRSERADMLSDLGVRRGDVVVMRSVPDIGHGREVPAIKSDLEGRGVTIEEHPPAREARPLGRPPKFAPTPEQDKRIEALYRSYLVMRHVRDRVKDIMGYEVARHQLISRYGKRWAKQAAE